MCCYEKDILSNYKCQLQTLDKLSQPIGNIEILSQLKNRIRRIFKRRWNCIKNIFSKITSTKNKLTERKTKNFSGDKLEPGNLVRVRSKEEIQATLNRWNQLKGCAFMEEMWQYCGTSQKVLKRVEKFLDERDYLMKRTKGIVILDGVICEGTKDFGACDRSCFFFWRQEWLEKIA